MQGNKRKDTAPEMAVRREVHRRGLRYRVDAPPLRGLRRRADLVFTKARVAVFVDGCFWHGCPTHFVPPRTNAQYWLDKIAINRARDRETDAALLAAGWTVLRYWAHEAPLDIAAAVQAAVRTGSTV
jgi:DNA mismatch endonuclease (patch repair protein)